MRLRIFGGHHDAGDYNPRAHIEVAQALMDAYEIAPRKFSDGQLNIPEKANSVPDILDEADWALRLWFGLQDSDGGVHNGTESNGDPNFIQSVELNVYKKYDQNRAAWAYARCPATAVDAKVQAMVREAIISRADAWGRNAATMAYSFIRSPYAPINWGTGAYANWLTPVIWAWSLTGEDKYRYWIVRTCDNMLGANPLNRSWVVGLGARTVRAPLHNSRYSHFGEVVRGIQVEGPHQRGVGYRVAETAWPKINEKFASLYTFVDAHFAIAMDEGVVTSQAKTMAAFGLLLGDRK